MTVRFFSKSRLSELSQSSRGSISPVSASRQRAARLRQLSALVMGSALAFSACGDDNADDDSSNGGKSTGMGGKGGALNGGQGGLRSGGAGGRSTGGGTAGKAAVGGTGASAGAVDAAGAGGQAAEAGGGGASGDSGAGEAGAGGADATPYVGPTVGRAKTFATLAYSAITNANASTIIGEIGVSAGAVSTITGFDAPSFVKYGMDSLAPNDQRTRLAQQDVTALVGNIDPRRCDADYTNVVGGLTGDVTLYPGVTCMNDASADVLLDGHVTLDARGDPNAFFVIRGNLTLTVADAAEVVLMNGAQACSVFWRIKTAVTIGKTVKFYGTIVAGTSITMNTGSTLTGRALAQTAGVQLDANAISIPSDGLVGSAGVCTHVQ